MKPTDFNLRHLRAFCAVVEGKSVSKAADLVHLTQPAVTHAIAKIEAQVAYKLFDRMPGRIVPNDAAVCILPRFQAAYGFIQDSAIKMVQVKALTALAQYGSYVSSARETGLSQPSLHRSVRDLTAVLGKPLVERHGRGIKLTSDGRYYARRFRLALRELRAALEELDTLAGHETGKITIGAMPLCRARLLPHAMIAFYKRYPHVVIKVVEGSYAELIEPLRDGSLDMMVGAVREDDFNKDVTQDILLYDQPAVFARIDHPLAHLGREPGLKDFCDYPWIMPSPSTPLRKQWEATFKAEGLDLPSVPMECGSATMIRQVLQKSDCLTVLSPDQVAMDVPGKTLSKLLNIPGRMQRCIGLTSRTAWQPTPLQTEFTRILRQQA
ncbi:MAG: LysR family transcriptional regulator [Pseudomonadota bacterium]